MYTAPDQRRSDMTLLSFLFHSFLLPLFSYSSPFYLLSLHFFLLSLPYSPFVSYLFPIYLIFSFFPSFFFSPLITVNPFFSRSFYFHEFCKCLNNSKILVYTQTSNIYALYIISTVEPVLTVSCEGQSPCIRRSGRKVPMEFSICYIHIEHLYKQATCI